VFGRSGTAWSQQAELTASDGASVDSFGNSVALSGDTALIGAPTGNRTGAAYVFGRSGTTWSQQAKLTASDGAFDDLFGYSVALSGDSALIGATGKNVAYVFGRSLPQHVLTVRTSGLGPNSTHISNNGSLLGLASDATPLTTTLPEGTALALTADALVSGGKGIQYFFQGFTPPPPATLTADTTTTARYETMAQLIGDALANGGIYGPGAQGQATALTQQFAAVQADLAAGNDAAQALLDTQSFINHVQAQTGKKITPATATTLVLDALLVYHAALCQAESAGQISAAQATADYSYYSGLVTQLRETPLPPC
jgi:hypothetical protein